MGVSVPEVVLLGSMFRWRLVAALVVSVFVVAVGSGAVFASVLGSAKHLQNENNRTHRDSLERTSWLLHGGGRGFESHRLHFKKL